MAATHALLQRACLCCHTALGEERVELELLDEEQILETSYCSDACRKTGPGAPVRKAVGAQIDLDPDKHGPMFRQGLIDALLGFDRLNKDAEYTAGFAYGMDARSPVGYGTV